jgi:hypothetical protein
MVDLEHQFRSPPPSANSAQGTGKGPTDFSKSAAEFVCVGSRRKRVLLDKQILRTFPLRSMPGPTISALAEKVGRIETERPDTSRNMSLSTACLPKLQPSEYLSN